MRRSGQLADLGFRILNAVHRSVLRASGGRIGRRAFGMEVIELVTIGRRSGQRRLTMLTVPVIEGDSLVLVASKGGDQRDPDWMKNLVATPQIEVTMRGERRRMLARLASNEEHARLWPQVVASYGPYDHYRQRAHRTIPLVICTPDGVEGQ